MLRRYGGVRRSHEADETVGRGSRGYDAGKKINDRKRHLVVDTRGLPLLVMATPASLNSATRARKSTSASAQRAGADLDGRLPSGGVVQPHAGHLTPTPLESWTRLR